MVRTPVPDIEDLHQQALNRGASSYKDPSTGFTCFTELIHLKRGTCCGNACRHCPFGWEQVPGQSRPAKLASGDYDTARRMVREIQNRAQSDGSVRACGTSSQSHVHNDRHTDSNGNGEARRHDAVPTNTKTNTDTATTGTVASGSLSSSEDSDRDDDTDSLTARIPAADSTSDSTSPTARPATDKNVPYTRGGDRGTSQLLTGERRRKDDCNFEALGCVDELCSVVGVVHANLEPNVDYGPLNNQLLDVMGRLFDVGSHVAKPKLAENVGKRFVPNGVGDGIDARLTAQLEEWIDAMTDRLPELTSFILPAGAKAAAQLHVARTVCRRAERRLVPLVDKDRTCDPNALMFINRLSDYFFTAARWVNYCEGREEIQYQRQSHSMQRQRVARTLQQQQERLSTASTEK